jgi:putative transposase
MAPVDSMIVQAACMFILFAPVAAGVGGVLTNYVPVGDNPRINRQATLYKRHGFSHEIIHYAVWFYYRFNLSHRDIEDLLAERGNSERIAGKSKKLKGFRKPNTERLPNRIFRNQNWRFIDVSRWLE